MSRTAINVPSKDTVTDDGSVRVSKVLGSQFKQNVEISSLTSLSGYTITCVAKEGENDGTGAIPSTLLGGGDTVTLPISDIVDNSFNITFLEELGDSLNTPPTIGKSSYYFFSVKLADSGTGSDQEIIVPVRGLIEIQFAIQP